MNPEGTIAITVATGSEATGRADDSPTTTSAKGPTTVEALEVNRQQYWLPGLEPVSADQDDEEEGKPVTWILLVHHARNAEIRAELSLPLDVAHDGRVSVWQERILLRPLPLDGEPVAVTAPTLPEIDVAVRRKA
ncbi:hypothetical protein OOT46_02540 [Aquabacterium sp. A7-Y]|uniref:hypothetical protein n=1 Tax=Aquabacterium sp. A7-Y TaxID=1349605 RepID=UPI00223CB952|nr:hypothetical protein [Aquabacterium sp. A7-Y]MCW7536732.1 hypothetical protein [Aquabacterium sp. A7-Y]